MLDYHNHQRLEKQSVRVKSWPSFAWFGWRWWSGYRNAIHHCHQHDKQAILLYLWYHCNCLLLWSSNYNDMEVAVLRQPFSAAFYL